MIANHCKLYLKQKMKKIQFSQQLMLI